MATVLLVRHGRTRANADGVLAGWTPGVDLDDKGREQAVALAARLDPVRLTRVVTSPLERTRQTADLMLGGREVPVEADERVGECRYGDWTGRPLKELRGFQRVHLQPGEARDVVFTLDPGKDLRHYDEQAQAYAVVPGEYELQVGASSADIRARTRLAVEQD